MRLNIDLALWVVLGLSLAASLWLARPRRAQPRAAGVVTRRVKVRRARADSFPLPRFVEPGDDLELTVISTGPELSDGAAELLDARDFDELRPSRVDLIYEDEADVDEPTAPRARILTHAQGDSDCGRLRQRNEDRLLVLPSRSVFVVADGMGGYRGGEVASELAVRALERAYSSKTFQGSLDSGKPIPRRARDLALAIQSANHAVHSHAAAHPELAEMGTTLLAARFSPRKQRVYIGHVGDSRCYRIRRGSIRQLTVDHNLASIGLSGPNQNRLVRAIGIEPSVSIDLIVDKPSASDVYCLCSDGLPKMLTDQEICRTITREPDLEAAVYSLIEQANDRGGNDNITVVLVRVAEAADASLRTAFG